MKEWYAHLENIAGRRRRKIEIDIPTDAATSGTINHNDTIGIGYRHKPRPRRGFRSGSNFDPYSGLCQQILRPRYGWPSQTRQQQTVSYPNE
jgi:hypothetical protein